MQDAIVLAHVALDNLARCGIPPSNKDENIFQLGQHLSIALDFWPGLCSLWPGKIMNPQVYERLLSVARDRNRGYTTYGEISPLADLDMENPIDRDMMSKLLEEIARHEQHAGRPMLTAVVIHQVDNIPGEGFFKIASEFGRFNGREKLRFWIDALNEVHEYWQRK